MLLEQQHYQVILGVTATTGAFADGGILCDTDKFVVADTGNLVLVSLWLPLTGALNANGGIVYR